MGISDDLLAPAVRDDPHAYFHQLRASDPVHWNVRHRAWILTRYDDVMAGFRDPRLSSERIGGDGFDLLERWMVFLDPPDHTRLRRLVGNTFSARAVAGIRDRIEVIVDEYVARLAGGRGALDYVSQFAAPLPAAVIAELMGVPAGDRRRFLQWSDDIAGVVFGAVNRPNRRARAAEGLREFDRYFRRLIDETSGTLVAALADARDGDDALTTEEIVSTCTLLLFAGHSTTTSLLTTGLLSLLRHPGELERFRDDDSIAASAVEELLRYEGPTGLMVRIAAEPLDVDGRSIAAGDRVFLGVLAANRDPARFSDPDRLDFARGDSGQLGFGFGIHHCLGAPLARLETELALRSVVQRFPHAALVDEPLEWGASLLGRGLARLRVDLGPHSAGRSRK